MRSVCLPEIERIESLARCRDDVRGLTRKAHRILELLPLDPRYIAKRADPNSEREEHDRLSRLQQRYWHGCGGVITKATLLLAKITQARHFDESLHDVFSDECWKSVRAELLSQDLRTLRANEPDNVPVLRSARVLRTLVAAQSSVASVAGFSALRRVLEELYSAANRDYSVGGASAGRGGQSTAFITSECVRSLLSFARILERTGALLESIAPTIGEAELRRERREHGLEPEWSACDLEPGVVSAQCNLHHRMYNTLVELTVDEIRDLARVDTPEELAERIRSMVLMPLCKTVGRAIESIAACSEAETIPPPDGSEFQFRGMAYWLATEYARRLLEDMAAKGRTIRANLEAALDGSGPGYRREQHVLDAAALLAQGAEEVRLLTRPASSFFSRVLDREIARAASDRGVSPDLSELLFAAAGLGSAMRDWSDPRIEYALRSGLTRLSVPSPWLPGKPFVLNEHGFTLNPILTQVSAAALRIAQKSGVQLSPEEVAGLLRPIRETFEETPDGGPGWRHDHEAGNRRSQWVSAVVATSLHKFLQTLDKQINTQILQLFRYRTPADVFAGLHLDLVCYSDYSLGALRSSVSDLDAGRERLSAALVLARVRAHLVARRESDKISFVGPANGEREYSLILHGPPGTGKTSLMEAIALTAERPIVQITPSDIITSGQEGAGHQLDLVFRALSRLTDAVVIFDEFDQLLSSRAGAARAPQNLFELIASSALTKLRDLNDVASENRIAYGLATNFLRSLDEAVTRQGRFGRRVGVYNPDPLSRATRVLGRLSRECFAWDNRAAAANPGGKRVWLARLGDPKCRKRMARVVLWTAGTSVRDLERLLKETARPTPGRGGDVEFRSPVFRYVLSNDAAARKYLEDRCRTAAAEATDAAGGVGESDGSVEADLEQRDLAGLARMERELAQLLGRAGAEAWEWLGDFLADHGAR